MSNVAPVDRRVIHDELERARSTFHRLLDAASPADLRRPSEGTRWTNEQLLFHMLFGYLIVRALLVLVRIFGRLPAAVGRLFARALDSATAPFNAVNYWGSCAGAKVFNHRRMGAEFDRITASLQHHLATESEADLHRGMPYPRRWDPFFQDFMTLADIYHYPSQHFDFHQQQLTLNRAR